MAEPSEERKTATGRPFWRSVLTYGAASVFLGSALHLANLVWTHFLTPEDYGRFANLEVVFGVAAAALTFGQYQYHLVFVKKAGARPLLERRAGAFVLGSLLLGSAVAALSLALPAEGRERVFGAGVPAWALAAVLLAGGLSVGRHIAQGIHEGEGRALPASLWKEAVDGARPFIALPLFLWLGWTWQARWGGLVLAHGGAGLLALWILLRAGRIRRPRRGVGLREPLAFVLPVVVSMIAYVAYDSADRLFLTAYAGLDAVGRYHVAYKLALVAQTVNVVMLRSFNPLYYEAYHRGDHEGADALIRSTATKTLGAVALVALGLPAILAVVPVLGAPYQSTLTLIPIVVVGLGLHGLCTFWQAALYARSKSFAVLVIGLGTALMNVGLNAVLVPRYAEMGAAVATLIAFATMLILTIIVVRRVLMSD